jgi:hypothetical protein
VNIAHVKSQEGLFYMSLFFKNMPQAAQTTHCQDQSKRGCLFIQMTTLAWGPEQDQFINRPYNSGFETILFEEAIH